MAVLRNIALLSICVLAACASENPTPGDRPADEPVLESGAFANSAAGDLTVQLCTNCHTFTRVERALEKDVNWDALVLRMAQKSNSGISSGDAREIAAFLKSWKAE
ncbi:MAG: photosystem P840 reaction-center cytochrome c-551 [Planctomycetes bacterium]|nr:photosystem P840 reaction-center cytochrome c-551 [Planctomycetota bacterium]